MKKTLKRFLVRHLVLTILTYIVGFVVFKLFFVDQYFPFLLFLPVLFYGVNTLFFYTLLQYAELEIRKFSSRFMMVFGGKILFFLFFIMIYAYLNPEKAVTFLITFFILYFINSVYVIIKTVQMLKNR